MAAAATALRQTSGELPWGHGAGRPRGSGQGGPPTGQHKAGAAAQATGGCDCMGTGLLLCGEVGAAALVHVSLAQAPQEAHFLPCRLSHAGRWCAEKAKPGTQLNISCWLLAADSVAQTDRKTSFPSAGAPAHGPAAVHPETKVPWSQLCDCFWEGLCEEAYSYL